MYIYIPRSMQRNIAEVQSTGFAEVQIRTGENEDPGFAKNTKSQWVDYQGLQRQDENENVHVSFLHSFHLSLCKTM